MIAILSPAKTLDYESQRELPEATTTRLPKHTDTLVKTAAQLSVSDLMSKMHISQALAQLNYDRYHDFWALPERPAIQAFDGDVYTGLDAKTLGLADIKFAQDHLRILSGLYGLLRPLDLMRPYRLEMGTKRFPHDSKLSIWWEHAIADLLAQDAVATSNATVLNLASQEYYAAVKNRLPDGIRVVDVDFIAADGRFITMHAKLARGVMARWMIVNRVTDIDAMRGFDDGYAFDASQSSDDRWIFRAVS